MSLLDRLRAAITFRTSRPTFEAGEEFTVYVTGANEAGAVVRVGDSMLRLRDGESSLVDRKVRLRVTSFDPATSEGEAELLSVVDDE